MFRSTGSKIKPGSRAETPNRSSTDTTTSNNANSETDTTASNESSTGNDKSDKEAAKRAKEEVKRKVKEEIQAAKNADTEKKKIEKMAGEYLSSQSRLLYCTNSCSIEENRKRNRREARKERTYLNEDYGPQNFTG